MSVAKVIEISACSSESFDKAIEEKEIRVLTPQPSMSLSAGTTWSGFGAFHEKQARLGPVDTGFLVTHSNPDRSQQAHVWPANIQAGESNGGRPSDSGKPAEEVVGQTGREHNVNEFVVGRLEGHPFSVVSCSVGDASFGHAGKRRGRG